MRLLLYESSHFAFSLALLGCCWLSDSAVESQNSIKPRRSKVQGVLTCPDVSRLSESRCKMACTRDEHCENYSERWCCPVAEGSSCRAECQVPVLTLTGGGTCYDFELGRQYRVGDVLERNGACCRCVDGGRMNCTTEESCIPGCYFGGSYYNNGEAIPRSACRNCSCHKGEMICSWNTNCTQEKCKYKGKVYKLEHMVSINNGCKQCVCQYNGWHCMALACKEVRVSSAKSVAMATRQSISLGFVCLIQYLLLQRR